MKKLVLVAMIISSVTSWGMSKKSTKRKPSASNVQKPHVHLMHMDGIRPDVFKRLMEHGQLPHYRYLLDRGRINYSNSTVDKSETMKVILSYLTSSIDSEVVGWWQFNRDNYSFRNFWLNPIEVINYALGLEFPKRPTIHDFLAANGETTLSGFALHRRSVSFENYSRAYFEGLVRGVFNHQYLDQAHATMDGFIEKYIDNARKNIIPAFSHSLLAPADEFAHLDGITDNHLDHRSAGNKPYVTKCFGRENGKEAREKSKTEIFFNYLDKLDSPTYSSIIYVDKTYKDGKIAPRKGRGHFHSVKKLNETKRFCIDVPIMNFDSKPGKRQTVELTNMYYVLGMIGMDIQLGRFLNTLHGLKLRGCKGNKDICYKKDLTGIAGLLKDRGNDSLFSQTLFVFTGDHGMVDSKHKMEPCKGKDCSPRHNHGRALHSSDKSFINMLNEKLSYSTELTEDSDGVGIDDSNIPDMLKFPHLDKDWVKNSDLQKEVTAAEAWSEKFYQEIRGTLKSELARKYWYLLFLKSLLVYPKLDEKLDPHKQMVKNVLANLYLKGIPEYNEKEVDFFRAKYDKHIRFVYGGGARNNAEIFLPQVSGDKYSWKARPTYAQILSFKGNNRKSTMVEIMRNLPSVGSTFIRKNNPLGHNPYGRMTIAVLGKKNNEAEIIVEKDKQSKQIVYGYEVKSGQDPLHLGMKPGQIKWGTYNEWNDFSVKNHTYLHNPVAGVGSYLYSTNSSIGDILLMHEQGWNFGGNSAGHGGIHAGEKKTILMVSGPGIQRGKLMAMANWQTTPTDEGGYRLVNSPYETNTTVLDIAPTILNWLGYEKDALSTFGNSGLFKSHLKNWVKRQRGEIKENYLKIDDLQKVLKWAEFEKFNINRLDPYLKRMFDFIPITQPELIDTEESPTQGNILVIEGTTP